MYLCTTSVMVIVGVIVVRRVLVVFGAFGVYGYLGYLAYNVFEDSWLFPIALSAIALLIICLGVAW